MPEENQRAKNIKRIPEGLHFDDVFGADEVDRKVRRLLFRRKLVFVVSVLAIGILVYAVTDYLNFYYASKYQIARTLSQTAFVDSNERVELLALIEEELIVESPLAVGKFDVKVASVEDQEIVDLCVKGLEKAGFKTYKSVKQTLTAGKLYEVSVGHFDTRIQAAAVASHPQIKAAMVLCAGSNSFAK